MYPVCIKIGALQIYSYGFLVALAFLSGIFLSIYFAKKEGLSAEAILDLAVYVIISSILGARLFYVVGQWQEYRDNPIEIFMLQKGGLVFLGGLLLGLLTIVAFARVKKIPLLKLLDAIAPGVLLGYSIGRIGCFLNGCCFGVPANNFLGVVFPPNSLAGSYFPDAHLYPTQLFSSAAMFLACLALVWTYRHKRYDGQIFYWGLILYSIYRFLIEFLRYSPIHWLALTPSQWIVLFGLIYGSWGLFHHGKRV